MRNKSARVILLFLASLLFYGWNDPIFVAALLIAITAILRFGLWLETYRDNKTVSKIILSSAITLNVFMLILCRYFNFINPSGRTEIKTIAGTTVFILNSVSYLTDVYRGQEAEKNFFKLGLFMTFFPKLQAGPLISYKVFYEWFKTQTNTAAFQNFSSGACKFILGLSKKVLLATQLAVITDNIFNARAPQPLLLAWLGGAAFALQVYYDFSGYCDMAVGLGGMFGIILPDNIDKPYTAKSISEFIESWNVSLAAWIKEYIRISLGKSKDRSVAARALILLIGCAALSMLHETSLNFLVLGIYYFILILIEKLLNKFDFLNKLAALRHTAVIFAVTAGWIIFRAENIPLALEYLKDIFGLGTAGIVNDEFYMFIREKAVYLAVALIFIFPVENIFKKVETKAIFLKISLVLYPAVLTTLFLLCLAYLTKGDNSPLVYFNI